MYDQNASQSFYAASLITLPIAMTAYGLAEQGALSMNDRVVMQADDVVPGTGVIRNDPPGSSYTLRELCDYALREADNTASNMLLDHLGYDTVNALMQGVGAHDTFVERKFFDDAARLAGRDIRTSPRDMSLLFEIVASGQVVGNRGRDEILDSLADSFDEDKIRAYLPNTAQVMNKSGVLPAPDGLEHDSALIMTSSGRTYIVVVMMDSLPDNGQAQRAIADASQRIYDYQSNR
jgi:beta-lactamase class A